MQRSNAPSKLLLPFASAGGKNAIPIASQVGVTPGAASYVDGFPPLTRTAKVAGGVGPSGLDMNGALFEISTIARWLAAGGSFTYDATYANDSNVGGYPKGASTLRSDGLGFWINTVDNNVTDPESAGAAAAGWVPGMTNGVTAVTMTNANVTLTPLQYGKLVIVITGALIADVQLIFPAIAGKWSIVNATTGAHTITAKTAAGSGVVIVGADEVVGDGTDIKSIAAAASAAIGVPVGTVIYVAKSTAPAGYLKANGATVSRATYANLFAAIGTTFGVGDSSTTFGIPDLRGEFIRGWDDGRGIDSGRAIGSSQADDLKSHTHTIERASGYVGVGASAGSTGTGTYNISGATGGTETRPINIALLACIKY
jgi:hypothetical protein